MAGEETFTEQPSSALAHLPRIPFDLILQDLDLASFKNLRLASRQLAINSIYSRFFRSATTDTSLKNLESLHGHLSHPQLGPWLDALTIVATPYGTQPAETTVEISNKASEFGIGALRREPRDTWQDWKRVEDLSQKKVRNPDEQVQVARKDRDWTQTMKRRDKVDQVTDLLSDIFNKTSGLRTINLDASTTAGRATAGADHRGWYQSARQDSSLPSVWTAASQVFRVVTSAISRSDVELNTLRIFSDKSLCSVELREVESRLGALDLDAFAKACKHTTTFGLSFSTRRPGHLQNNPHMRELTGAATMLRMMPNLTSLDLQMFHSDLDNLKYYATAFTHIAEVKLAYLKKVSLRRLPLRSDDLITFLENHSKIEVLTLDGIELVTGSWLAVFTYLEAMPALENLRLGSLTSQTNHIPVNLEPVEGSIEGDRQDKEKWVSCGDGYILFTRAMCREEIRRGLSFKPQPEPTM